MDRCDRLIARLHELAALVDCEFVPDPERIEIYRRAQRHDQEYQR